MKRALAIVIAVAAMMASPVSANAAASSAHGSPGTYYRAVYTVLLSAPTTWSFDYSYSCPAASAKFADDVHVSVAVKQQLAYVIVREVTIHSATTGHFVVANLPRFSPKVTVASNCSWTLSTSSATVLSTKTTPQGPPPAGLHQRAYPMPFLPHLG